METREALLALPIWYVVFLLSLTCHEAAHAWVAWRGGDSTAYRGGQVSLNPLPHVRREPFGAVVVPLLSYLWLTPGWMLGWASAPYDPFWERRHPRRAALMAAAGPAANLALALVALGLLRLGMSLEVWAVPADGLAPDRLVVPAGDAAIAWEGLGRVLSVMLFLNALLFTFNLIPLPPMDGASVVAGVGGPVRALYDRFRSLPMGGMIGLVAAWAVFPYLFRPVVRSILLALYGI